MLLAKLNSLEHLNLKYNYLEGGISKTFRGMCSLKVLFLSGNNLNGQLRRIIHNLIGCANLLVEILDLEQNQTDFSAFPSLRLLLLIDNCLKGRVLQSLGKQSKLQILSLSDNPLEGVIFEVHFSKLIELMILDLSNNLLVFNFSLDWVPPS